MIKRIKRGMYKKILTPISCGFFRLLPIDKKKIVVDNFLGKGYGGNGKYIVEELLKQKTDRKIIWLMQDMAEELPEGVIKVKYGSLKAFYHFSTAGVWVDNVRNTRRPKKRKGQRYLQTWHGSLGLKMGEGQVEEKLSKSYVECAKADGKICDAILVGNKAQAECFREFFWLNENTEILESGLPYNDCFFDKEYVEQSKKRVREYFAFSEEEAVILYAPTFRDDGATDCYKLDFEKVLEVFERRTGKNCKLLITMHPNAVKKADFITYSEKIINGTPYGDVQEICCAVDYLITDYSSVSVDFSLLKKPVFLAALDLEEYDKLRGLTEIFYETPFSLARNSVELVTQIEEFSKELYEEKLAQFYEKYTSYERGTGAKEAVKWILQ